MLQFSQFLVEMTRKEAVGKLGSKNAHLQSKLKKSEQALKTAKYYHGQAENARGMVPFGFLIPDSILDKGSGVDQAKQTVARLQKHVDAKKKLAKHYGTSMGALFGMGSHGRAKDNSYELGRKGKLTYKGKELRSFHAVARPLGKGANGKWAVHDMHDGPVHGISRTYVWGSEHQANEHAYKLNKMNPFQFQNYNEKIAKDQRQNSGQWKYHAKLARDAGDHEQADKLAEYGRKDDQMRAKRKKTYALRKAAKLGAKQNSARR